MTCQSKLKHVASKVAGSAGVAKQASKTVYLKASSAVQRVTGSPQGGAAIDGLKAAATRYAAMAGSSVVRDYALKTLMGHAQPSYVLTKKGIKNTNLPNFSSSLKAGFVPKNKLAAGLMAYSVLGSGYNTYRRSLHFRKRAEEKKAEKPTPG